MVFTRTLLLYRWARLLDDSIHTVSHDLYSNTIGYNEEKAIDPENFEIDYMMMSFEFLLATRVYQDTVNLLLVRLMTICKDNHLNALAGIYTYKQKLPYDTLFGLRKFGVNCKKSWEEFVFKVIFGLSQSTTGQRATKQRHLEKAGTIISASSKFQCHGWFCS